MKDNNKKKIAVKCEANVCPICGGMNLSYSCSEDDDNGRKFPWTCEDCGATGKESYTETFDGNHYDVETGDGEPVEIVAPEAAPDPEDICPVCGGELEYTGNTGEIKYGISQEWRCTKCNATGWAKFDEPDAQYIFTGEHDDVRLADGSEWNREEISPPKVPAAQEPVKAVGGWFIPVTWEMHGVVRIPFEKAATLQEAFKQIKDDPDIELPKGHYVDDSFAPSYELEQIEEVRSAYNGNRPDGEVAV